MKMFLGVILAAALVGSASAHTEIVNGIEWSYNISDQPGEGRYAIIGRVDDDSWFDRAAITRWTEGKIEVPSSLGGFPVRRIEAYAFARCSGLTSGTISQQLLLWRDMLICSMY